MDIATRISTTIRVMLGLAYLYVFLLYCGKIYENSKTYLQSYLRSAQGLLKWEKYFYKSCRPIAFTIGQFSTIDRMTYLTVLSDIVLANVSDLLIAYKATQKI